MTVCRYCKSFSWREEILGSGPHYGKRVCNECNGFIDWLPKPKNEFKRPKNKYTADQLGQTWCQMCLRPGDMLGDTEVLEVHHVVEIQDGGEDAEKNIWVVCTACHKYIHHARLYMFRHQRGRMTKGKLVELMDQDGVPESVRSHMVKMLENNRG